MQTEKQAENRLGAAPVGRLMLSVGVPIVCSMMLQAVYNIVDSAYLSRMREGGEEALTALGLAFPVQLLMVAVAIGTGVGANALLARTLGAGDREKASRTAGNAVFLGFVISVFFAVFGLVCVPVYVNSQSAGGSISPTVLGMAAEYLRICCCVSFGIILFSIYEKLLQGCGRSLYSTIGQIAGAVVNIVLDPFLIYGWCGLPELGIRGAAWATVIGQIFSALLVFAFHTRLDREVDKAPRYLRPQAGVIREIYAIGLPAIISQALMTVMTYGLNVIFGQLPQVGERAVTVYGLYCKVQQLILFAAYGVRDAITPIVSYNFGMGSRPRVRAGIRCGLIFTLSLMAAGLVVIEAAAVPLTGVFALSDVTYAMCISCMRIMSLAFVFAGASIALQGVFQAMGCGMESLVVSAGRQVVFILPVAWLLARFVTGADNVSLVWWTFLIGEGLTLLCAVLLYRRTVRRKVAALEA